MQSLLHVASNKGDLKAIASAAMMRLLPPCLHTLLEDLPRWLSELYCLQQAESAKTAMIKAGSA
ncbi:MAG: hypothetical protein AB1861_07880 [Cyanobacteriota bacterium]